VDTAQYPAPAGGRPSTRSRPAAGPASGRPARGGARCGHQL